MASFDVNPDSNLMIGGGICGLLFYVVWFFIVDRISKLIIKPKPQTKDEDTSSKDESASLKEDKAEDEVPAKPQSANPRLFDHLKICK